MEYAFPPPPPGYDIVFAARVILVTWSIIGLGVLVFRLWNWTSIRITESRRWAIAAILSCVVGAFGRCDRHVYDNNLWLTPIFFAALAVPTAGIAACWAKLSMESADAKTSDRVSGAASLVFSIWFVIGVYHFMQNPLSHPAEAHYRTNCKNNLKQIGLALHNYHDAWQTFPPATNSTPEMSWRVAILPFLDQQLTYARYKPSSPWNSPANLPLAREKLSVFNCPSNSHPQDAAGLWYSAYSMPTGPHSVGSNPRGTTLRQITDGSSRTFLVVEACGTPIVWTEPRDVNIQTQPAGINLNGPRRGESAGWLSSHHTHGAHTLLGDGAVRFIYDRIDPALLRKLATIDDGEEIDWDYY
ncbi:MAG TPA: DUF1559 domain-containing protein [Schlesneria sp.]